MERSGLGWRELAGMAVLAAVVAAGLLTSPERTLRWVAALGDDPLRFAPVLLGVYLVRPALGWPTMLVSAVVGAALGPVVGLPVALCGAVFTSLPAFYAARWFGVDRGLVGRASEVGRRYFSTTGAVRGTTAARLAPIPADAVSVAAGLGDVRLRHYALGTLAGELPWTVAAVVLGSSVEHLGTAGLEEASLPLLAAGVVAAVVLLAGPAYRRWRGTPV